VVRGVDIRRLHGLARGGERGLRESAVQPEAAVPIRSGQRRRGLHDMYVNKYLVARLSQISIQSSQPYYMLRR